MMLEQKHRKHVIITFIVVIVLLVISLGSFWNAFVGAKEKLGFATVFFTTLAFGAVYYLYRTAYSLTDYDAHSQHIKDLVNQERVKVLEEIQTKEKEEEHEDVKEEDIKNKVKDLIPIGKFKNIESFGKKVLVNLSNALNCVQGVFYVSTDGKKFSFSTGYALTDKQEPKSFEAGENLNGEVADSKEIMIVDEIPESYFQIESGLGSAKPGCLIIVPIISKNKTIAILELASFSTFTDKEKQILENFSEQLEPKLNSLVKA